MKLLSKIKQIIRNIHGESNHEMHFMVEDHKGFKSKGFITNNGKSVHTVSHPLNKLPDAFMEQSESVLRPKLTNSWSGK